MKIDKLHWVFGAVSQSAQDLGLHCDGHYHFEYWRNMDGSEVTDTQKLFCLNKVKQEKGPHHQSGSSIVWLYFSEISFALALHCTKTPRASTRNKYRDKLNSVYEAAVNSYRVAHNALTGLLAKDAFSEKLLLCISSMAASPTVSDDTQDSSLPKAVSVMALDIDYFKQVNDTWGHYYGDQVLKAFGQRLEEVAKTIKNSSASDVDIFVGHPSGEEFLIVILANAARDQFTEWASLFRVKIADSFLPSDSEWSALTRNAPATVSPPLLQERSITTSIGVTWHTSVPRSGDPTKFGADLLERADTALYRAKAAGRNQVIFYDEILASCGKILEYDKDTGVAALDIGKNVGVTVGQEFKVFPSTYTGQKKFTVNDGRTTRTLGFYPKVESGRLVVFNSQPEISFACVSPHDNGHSTFEAGASLEAIPAGSIRHLLPHFSRFFPAPDDSARSDGVQSIKDYLDKSAEQGKYPFALVFRFSKESDYSKKYGTASLNYALARLLKGAQATFHAAKYVEVLDRSSICVVGTERAYKEKMVIEFSNEITDELPELGVLTGVYCRTDAEKENKSSEVPLKQSNSLDFAIIAASELGREPDMKVRHFGFGTAYNILQAHRDARTFKSAYADYQKLSSLGVIAANLENLAGLISGSLGNRQASLTHYEAAIKLSPETLIYKSNYCTAALRSEDVDPALAIMNQLPWADIEKLKSLHPYGFTSYAGTLARAKLSDSKLFLKDRFIKIADDALAMEDSLNDHDGKYIREVKSAL